VPKNKVRESCTRIAMATRFLILNNWAQPALAADVARRREKWLKLRFFVYGKMLSGRSRATRLKRRTWGRERKMLDYLSYYLTSGSEPFRSLSSLSDIEAIPIMESLYKKHKGNMLFNRFKDPYQYFHNRKETELWVRNEFIKKGGAPIETYPICMVLGSSNWIESNAPDPDAHFKIMIPLSEYSEVDISFTYPDSMVSLMFLNNRPNENYIPEYHGRVFTLTEIQSIIEEKGLPIEEWGRNYPEDIGSYIEVQVWNQKPLGKYKKKYYEEMQRLNIPVKESSSN
jgi:hypothetical protein